MRSSTSASGATLTSAYEHLSWALLRGTKTPNVYINTAIYFVCPDSFSTVTRPHANEPTLSYSPIVVKRYEPLNINDWEWLMDPPTRRPQQTDRNSDRHMHPSRSVFTFLSVPFALSACLTHSLIHLVPRFYTQKHANCQQVKTY